MIYYTFLPTIQDKGIDWSVLENLLPWHLDMVNCIQDPVFHAEGDVWTHTKMVVEALLAEPFFKSLPATRQRILFWAAVLHDIAKPKTREVTYDTELGRERIGHPSHSRLGEMMARPFLWHLGVPFQEREEICGIIRYHQRIFHLLNARNPLKYAIEIAECCRAVDLYLHAVADHKGRTCLMEQDTELQLELSLEMFTEHGIDDKPWSFANGVSRHDYFAKSDRSPHYCAHISDDDFEVILLSGLPGSGKDHLITSFYTDLPVISLDDIREDIGAAPTGNQGEVIRLAFEQARKYLRKKQSFVWNATNLSKDLRSKPLRLFKDYNARTKIHYLEVNPERLFKQNRERDSAVPEKVIERMLTKWTPPEPWEADQVIWQVADLQYDSRLLQTDQNTT